MPYKDKEKRREYRRKWYQLNSTSEKKHVKTRKKQLRIWLDNYKKNLSCTICFENHPATIDFHHISGKEFEIAYMVSNGYSIKRIEEELKKCKVLCSNCHRKIHYSNNKI